MGNLNLGIIGAGFMGKPYSVALQMAKRFFGEKMHDVSFRVLATTQENTGGALAKNLGIEEWTGDWRS